MKQDIINKNDKGQLHGYIECYSSHNNLIYARGNFKNHIIIGYIEWHNITRTEYHIR